MTHRSHNARLIHCAPYRVGAGQRFVLTFQGSKDCVVDMDATAIAELKEALPDICPCCHQLTPRPKRQTNEKEPPCRQRSVAQITRISPYKFEGGEWDPVELLKDIKGALPVKAPPCPFCKHWNPGRRQWGETIDCCTKPDDEMWGDFSCYERRGGTE